MVQDNPPAMTLVPPPVGRAARLDGIDTLRGLSIIAVVLHHINLRMMFNGVSFESFLPTQMGKALFWNGANGVTVFFAISGFLITTNSMRRWGGLQHLRVFDFYRLRFARIVPLLVALLLLLSALHLAHAKGFVIPPERATLGRALLAATTFHVNVLEASRGYLPASWDILWSLSVEEMFYLFFPLACRLLGKGKLLTLFLFAFVALGPFARTVFTQGNPVWREYSYLGGMDAIALGCLTALLIPGQQLSPRLLRTLPDCGIALVALCLCFQPLVEKLPL